MERYRTVNLEQGMPYADQAIRRLTYELHAAKRDGLAALKIIHGYGSSGAGGRLRVELRRYLDRQRVRGVIAFYVPGESFSIFDEDSRRALAACGALRSDPDLERHNNGISVIIL